METRLSPLLDEGILDDPWVDGQARLTVEPVILDRSAASRLAQAAVALAMMLDEAVPAAAEDDGLLASLGFDPTLAAVARLDAPRWLGLARADVFVTEDENLPQVCEINADTPTGVAECTRLGALAARSQPELADPSAKLRDRYLAMIDQAAAPGAVVGIVDPTEMTEDLCHIRLLTRWLEEAGYRVVRGSPFNLHEEPGDRIGLFGTPVEVLIRHYKTDWWACRRPIWRDETPVADAAPLTRELLLIAQALVAGTLAVVNPFGAAIAQSKRSLALPWERPDLFAADTLAAVRRHLPETRFLESLPQEHLVADRERWVLKSDFGCEGEEVLIGRDTAPDLWLLSLQQAMPGRWIVQRAFRPRRDPAGGVLNHGVYLIGGLPSGIYTRRSALATDRTALSCPTLVRP